MYTCEICNRSFDKYDSLRKHCGWMHGIKTEDCFIKYKLNGIRPVCECGCNQFTRFYSKVGFGSGFRKYCKGHHCRVHNNWGHNKDAIERSAETRRRQYASGERKVWCDGLTKNNNDILKKIGEKRSASYTDDVKKEYSERMSEMRKDGTIPTLYKEQSSQWKGGVSKVQQVARSYKRLYDEWKYPILEQSKFKCIECGNCDNLHIHHDKETFSEIIKKVMTIEDYELIEDFHRKKLICDKIVDYHVNNEVSGKCLCRDCHKKHHPSLNFK